MNWELNIEAYLYNRLTPQEQADFYTQIQQNSDLRNLVMATKKRLLLDAILSAELQDEPDDPQEVRSQHSSVWRSGKFWGGLLLLGLLIGGICYFLGRPNPVTQLRQNNLPNSDAVQDSIKGSRPPVAIDSKQQTKDALNGTQKPSIDRNLATLAQQSFQQSRPTFVIDSSKVSSGNFGSGSILEEAKEAFNENAYREILQLTDEVPASSAKYLRAMAYLALKQAKEAKDLFQQILDNPSEHYTENWWNKADVEWFLILAKSQSGLSPQTDLEKILAQKSHKYHEAADRLYSTIKQ